MCDVLPDWKPLTEENGVGPHEPFLSPAKQTLWPPVGEPPCRTLMSSPGPAAPRRPLSDSPPACANRNPSTSSPFTLQAGKTENKRIWPACHRIPPSRESPPCKPFLFPTTAEAARPTLWHWVGLVWLLHTELVSVFPSCLCPGSAETGVVIRWQPWGGWFFYLWVYDTFKLL